MARRSRRRKQAHLADLEMQVKTGVQAVEKLKLENASLYKEFNDARQQFHEANTRAKVQRKEVRSKRNRRRRRRKQRNRAWKALNQRLDHAMTWARSDSGPTPRHGRALTTPRRGLSPLTTPRRGAPRPNPRQNQVTACSRRGQAP
ncbi:hypothetical protein PIB30_082503 [Stylosanthes scabra]|uniref:BZIP domain-containing protein n=1 Tax=Stylosanthes scabra TaxID=79078 RepID=A0ABU6VUM7_9FABA|nr:hypothetical protein [Stylosanthes scabra]